MDEKRSWLQQIKKHPVTTVLIALLAVVILLIILSILGYIFNWDWTGLNGYKNISTATTSPPKITTTVTYQPRKTLWDWLQLLIIPAVLAVAGYAINLTISRAEQAATKQRDTTERAIAQDNLREALLQAYIDNMSDLLLIHNLRESKPEDEARNVATARTFTVLRRLDAVRKGSVLWFLYESGLIDVAFDKGIIDLSEADLREAYLREASLSGVDLHYACLSKADLSGAFLSEANLVGVNLEGADLREADLCEANLCAAILNDVYLDRANLKDATGITNEELEKQAKSLKGATMPDGSTHP